MDGKGYGKYLVCSFACFLCFFFFFVFFFLEAYSIKLLITMITNECFKEELARFRFFVTVTEIQRMNTLFS